MAAVLHLFAAEIFQQINHWLMVVNTVWVQTHTGCFGVSSVRISVNAFKADFDLCASWALNPEHSILSRQHSCLSSTLSRQHSTVCSVCSCASVLLSTTSSSEARYLHFLQLLGNSSGIRLTGRRFDIPTSVTQFHGYDIWHAVYWRNLQHKCSFVHLTYILLPLYLGKYMNFKQIGRLPSHWWTNESCLQKFVCVCFYHSCFWFFGFYEILI